MEAQVNDKLFLVPQGWVIASNREIQIGDMVVEKLTDNRYDIFIIYNENDIDIDHQKVVIGTIGFRHEKVPFAELMDSLFEEVDIRTIPLKRLSLEMVEVKRDCEPEVPHPGGYWDYELKITPVYDHKPGKLTIINLEL